MIRTNRWFEESGTQRAWDHLLPQIGPKKILEVGSYEGASARYLSDLNPEVMVCIDTWSDEAVYARFLHNMGNRPNLFVIRERSDYALAVLAKNNYHFDFIYIDGSHESPDVIVDLVTAYRMLCAGGVMGIDDYLGGDGVKAAVDFFVTICAPKVLVSAYQFYVQKPVELA